MSRLLLIPIISILLIACSSEEPDALDKWFNDQGFVTSYSKQFEEIEITVKNFSLGFDSSASTVSSYAALGNVNGMEHMLYFSFNVLDSLPDTLKLRTDTIFYKNMPGASKPEHLDVAIYWFQHDGFEFKFPKKFEDSAEAILEWKTDAFFVSLPEELLKLKPEPPDTLRLLVGIKLRSDNTVLRIAPPSILDIRGLLHVAQKTNKSDTCSTCLHSGIGESLSISFDVKAEDKIKIAGKTVVFAQLVLPKQSGTTGSELGLPMPVHVFDELNYDRVNNSYVKEHGYPNVVFCEDDSLKLQVTRGLRNYTANSTATNLPPDTLGFTLWLHDYPMPKSDSLYFYNRPTYSKYDFGSELDKGATVTLKIWFTDFGDK